MLPPVAAAPWQDRTLTHGNDPDLALRSNQGFTEGWALYAESLGEDLGLYSDPYARFGRLSWDLMRAIRVVIDTGIHLHGWSEDKATAYFIAQTRRPAGMAALEVQRSRNPAMQLAYKIGEVRFHAMRRNAKKGLGHRFDLRRFHDALLRWGPLPLEILEERLDDCLRNPVCVSDLSAAETPH